jgi:hypothetical protein
MLKSKILNQVQDLVQYDSLGFGCDLTFELWHLDLHFSFFLFSFFLQLIQDI